MQQKILKVRHILHIQWTLYIEYVYICMLTVRMTLFALRYDTIKFASNRQARVVNIQDQSHHREGVVNITGTLITLSPIIR